MARQPRLIEDSEPAKDDASEPVVEMITYVPTDGGPVKVKWAGHTFEANVPKEIRGREDGTESEKLGLHIINSARNNPHFKVGDKRFQMPVQLPATAEQYRAYAVNWIKDRSIEHAEDLIRRFTRDRELQAACEVGSDDYAWLATLFMPRLHELARADGLNDVQVASLWAANGVNQLPWTL